MHFTVTDARQARSGAWTRTYAHDEHVWSLSNGPMYWALGHESSSRFPARWRWNHEDHELLLTEVATLVHFPDARVVLPGQYSGQSGLLAATRALGGHPHARLQEAGELILDIPFAFLARFLRDLALIEEGCSPLHVPEETLPLPLTPPADRGPLSQILNRPRGAEFSHQL